MKVISREPITIVEAKEIMNDLDEKNLGYEQKITLDYLRNYANLPLKSVQEAKENLSKMDFLKPHQIVMILNILPKTKEDLDVLFMKERITLTKEQAQQILDEIDKIREFEIKVKKLSSTKEEDKKE